MNITYTKDEIAKFNHYYYEWIDFLGCMHSPEELIQNYSTIVCSLEKKFESVGWDKENNINVIWLPPFVVGSIVGEKQFLEKYGAHTFCNGELHNNAWTRGIFLFHVKNISDCTSIILSPLELNISSYAL